MPLIFIFFCLVKMLIAVGAIVMLLNWPRAPGRLWLIFGFAGLLASSMLHLISLGIFRIAPQFSSPSLRSYDWPYLLSQFASFVAECISMGSTVCFLGATLVLGTQFRRLILSMADQDSPNSSQATSQFCFQKTRGEMWSHRENLLIILAITSIVFWPLGIVVRVLADRDLKEIKAGKMDPAAKSGTELAYLIGTVTSLILVAGSIALAILIASFIFGPQ